MKLTAKQKREVAETLELAWVGWCPVCNRLFIDKNKARLHTQRHYARRVRDEQKRARQGEKAEVEGQAQG